MGYRVRAKTTTWYQNKDVHEYSLLPLRILFAGTHLYVLYEGYGFSVASLYSLGFVAGAFSSPFTGALVDKFGRKKAAALYCVLEIIINYMEQHPVLIGLVLSRVIGGITTNLMCSCFEAWLVTEHRKRGFKEESLEIMLRDSGIVSNLAAIVSGFLAHYLAAYLGPVGPFQGAVAMTFFALLLVSSLWTENYGNSGMQQSGSIYSHMGKLLRVSLTICIDSVYSRILILLAGAFKTISTNSNISRIGIIQGLSEGSLQTFIFLWSPTLHGLASNTPKTNIGLDEHGEPAYGLIFGAFMASAVLGGFVAPLSRKKISNFLASNGSNKTETMDFNDRRVLNDGIAPKSVHILCSLCYALSSVILFVPCVIQDESPHAFSLCLVSFLLYEFLAGIYVPNEGVLRSILMPVESICSTMNILRVITNVAVAIGVFSTIFVPIKASFAALSVMMLSAAILQLSLIPELKESLIKLFRDLNSAFICLALMEVILTVMIS